MEKKRVLAVDDEYSVLSAVKVILEQSSRYEVLTLQDAKDIVAQVNRFKPDVILLDILMPALGGIEVCEILAKDAVGKNIPIIVVSALAKTADKLKAYKAIVVDYIIKPIDKNELIEKIEQALR